MHVAASSSHADVSQCSETLDDTSLRAGALGAASKRADALDSAALARRLGELAGDERDVQVDFLFHLDAFDRRRGFLDAGYASLWEFCQRALHLREGAAGRRISAMRVLRRFPVLEGALREGRLCLSTVALLGPLLTPENLAVVVGQAAFRTRAEVDRLVASLQPRAAPKDGLRRVAARPEEQQDRSIAAPPQPPLFEGAAESRGTGRRETEPRDSTTAGGAATPGGAAHAHWVELTSPRAQLLAAAPAVPPLASLPAAPLKLSPATAPSALSPPAAREGGQGARAPTRPEVRPVSADSYSLRVTIDALFKEDLETLRRLLSHKVPTGDLAAVLREAVRCGIEKHGKRRGAVAPSRKVGAKERGPQGVPAVPPAAAAATSQVARSGRSAAPGLGSAMKGERTASRNESPQNQPASEDETKAAGKHRGSRAPIPAAARREVWARDGGQCAWRGDGGRRCESRWQLEFDHVVPVALGGPSTALNLRLTCRVHNGLHAEQVFGPEHMARFRRGTPLPGEITTASGGAR